MRWRTLIAMIVLVLPFGCVGPTGNPSTIAAIADEARSLMRGPNFHWDDSAPFTQLPPTIAGLRPDMVTVSDAGVEINAPLFFDGGWGYYVPRRNPPPDGVLFRHYRIGPGVYWFYPY